jgi:hypothetical protein
MADDRTNDDDVDRDDEDVEDDDREVETDADTRDEAKTDDKKDGLSDAGRKAIRKERDARRAAQRELRELRTQHESDSEAAVRTAREEGSTEAEARWKPLVVNALARAAFADAGAGKPERLVKMLDLSSIEVDEDGEIDGLEDQIKSLREDYPELFVAGRRAPGADSGPKDGQGARRQTAEQRMAAQLLH